MAVRTVPGWQSQNSIWPKSSVTLTVYVNHCCCLLQRHAGDFGKSGAGHSIAWAFLRLSGLQQSQLLLDRQPLNVKLQLYRYSPGTDSLAANSCTTGHLSAKAFTVVSMLLGAPTR